MSSKTTIFVGLESERTADESDQAQAASDKMMAVAVLNFIASREANRRASRQPVDYDRECEDCFSVNARQRMEHSPEATRCIDCQHHYETQARLHAKRS